MRKLLRAPAERNSNFYNHHVQYLLILIAQIKSAQIDTWVTKTIVMLIWAEHFDPISEIHSAEPIMH